MDRMFFVLVTVALSFCVGGPSSAFGAAHCRYFGTNCLSDAGCWTGGNGSAKNETSSTSSSSNPPADCKCCTGFPYLREGECHRSGGQYIKYRNALCMNLNCRNCPRNLDWYVLQLQNRVPQRVSVSSSAMDNGHAHCAGGGGAFKGGGGGFK